MERNSASHPSARRRGSLPRLYVAIWVALSSMALTYLAMFSIRPDLADGLGRHIAALAGTQAGPAKAGEVDDVRALAEIAALRGAIDTLQADLNAVRAAIAVREDRDQAFAARLSSIEAQRVAEQASPLTTASIDPPSPRLAARDRADDEPQPNRVVKGRTVDVPVVEVAPPAPPPERAPPRPRESERIAFGPPQVKPTPGENTGPRGIQIATGPSVDALRISWMLLSERHKEILGRFEPRFVISTGASGPGFRLIAGPMESANAASKVCSELRARRVTCGVSAFGGEPL